MKPYSRFYSPLHFKLQEVCDPDTFKTLGESAWMLFDPYLLSTLDRIRVRYGKPVTINTWADGGTFKYRGFRPSACTEGAPLSAHRRGQACDMDIQGMTAEEVRQDIKKNMEHMDFMFINQVELNVTWLHISVANVPNRIMWVTP